MVKIIESVERTMHPKTFGNMTHPIDRAIDNEFEDIVELFKRKMELEKSREKLNVEEVPQQKPKQKRNTNCIVA